jgi:2-succinyl-5-enolpyruvyl-6-hydroxy-3-cyclohexene-1-carboxylate synthase
MKKCYGEIMYENSKGEPIHSDFTTDFGKEYLHKALDEWLDKGGGTGVFWVGDPKQLPIDL